MPSIHLESLSPFGRLAVKLDNDFSELARLSAQIQRLDIESDSGLEHAVKILNQFAQHGQSITEGIQDFSRTLQEAHAQLGTAAKQVAERAQGVQERKRQQNQLQEKLAQLEKQAKAANAGLTAFKRNGELKAELEQLDQHLAAFMEIAQAIKEEAVRLKFKGIERDAESILGILLSSRRKLSTVATAKK